MLGLMLTACDKTDETFKTFDHGAIVENCKNFYFSGPGSAVNLMCHTLLMLAYYPQWQ